MKTQPIGNEQFTKRKNRIKRIRYAAQFAFFLFIIGTALWLYITQPVYKPYTDESPRENGFVALSYFGVQKTEGSQLLIGQDNLRAHLEALKRQGYETITSDDIEAYYHDGKQLPEKALYLMFEDGRRDTAIFSNPILEDLNYRATTFTYPEKFDRKDTKFLMPDDLKRLPKYGFWDMGTNGYRLFFINVYDRYGNYLGEMDPLMYNKIAPYLGRRYNHYLMDYIRDKNGVPKESYDRMKKRISYDYEKLTDVYTETLGYVPKVSILMHANTGEFGNNPQVSAVNAYWLRKLFAMNFNREGYCLNVPDSSIYDLTRMQPQAWWPVNHLLMRIQYDTHKDMIFNTGEANQYSKWKLEKGAAEFKDQTIYLTSLPNDTGRIVLKNSAMYPDVTVTAQLLGNRAGTQTIYLRADDELQNYIAVKTKGNDIYITECKDGAETELFKKSIPELEGKKPISVDEDEHDAEVTELEAFSRYAPSKGLAKVYTNRLKEKTKETPKTIEEGSEEFVRAIQVKDQGNYAIRINLTGQNLALDFNGEQIANVRVSQHEGGLIALGAAWNDLGWQQRNLDDDVYDAVFRDFTVKNNHTDTVIFTTKYEGWEKVKYTAKKYLEKVVDWFVQHL